MSVSETLVQDSETHLKDEAEKRQKKMDVYHFILFLFIRVTKVIEDVNMKSN